jgi:hypothetical protein
MLGREKGRGSHPNKHMFEGRIAPMTFADVGELPRDPLDKLLGALDRLGREPRHSGSGWSAS